MTEAQERYRRVLDEEAALQKAIPAEGHNRDNPLIVASIRRMIAAAEGLSWDEQGAVHKARLHQWRREQGLPVAEGPR